MEIKYQLSSFNGGGGFKEKWSLVNMPLSVVVDE